MAMVWPLLRRFWPLAAFALLGGVLAWVWQDNRWQARYGRLEVKHEQALTAQALERAALAVASQTRLQELQTRIAALDERYSRELQDAQDNNQQLRADVDAGTRRLHLARENVATCRLDSADTAGAGVDDGAGVELSRAAGRAIFDIRAGIISDRAKLNACQAYVRGLQVSDTTGGQGDTD